MVAAADAGGPTSLVLDGEAAAARRAGHLPPAQERDLPLPADPGADRPPRGRLAGLLVAGRPRRAAPARPVAVAHAVAELGRRATPPPDRRRLSDAARGHADLAGPPHRADRRERPDRAEQAEWAMDEIMDGEATPGAGRRLPGRAAGQGRDGRGAGRAAAGMLERAVRIEVPGDASTSSAPAATGPTRSTSRRWPRWSSPGPATGWSSTATGPRRRPAARPTSWRRWASAWTCRRRGSPSWPRRSGITFCFAQAFHPALPARRRRPAASSASPTAFNFLGPLTNPAQPGARRSGWPTARMAPIVAGVLAARGGTRAGVPRRGRAGRADHRRRRRRCGGYAAAR